MYFKTCVLFVTINVQASMISSKGPGIIPEASTDNFQKFQLSLKLQVDKSKENVLLKNTKKETNNKKEVNNFNINKQVP